MNTCASCKKKMTIAKDDLSRFTISAGICIACRNKVSRIRDARSNRNILDSIDSPVLLMQPDPRQVHAANRKASELFGKNLSEIEGRRGGEVFDCVHAFSKAGCGKDPNCENCRIRNAIIDNFATGKSFNRISTDLQIRKQGVIRPYRLEVSTEKAGELAFLRIDRYEKIRK